jgi:hypothetical protein
VRRVATFTAVMTTMRIPKMRLSMGPETNLLVRRAPRNDPTAPTTIRTPASCRSTWAVEMCGMSAVKDGSVTATALMPAAFLGS